MKRRLSLARQLLLWSLAGWPPLLLASHAEAADAKISAKVLAVTHRAGPSGDWQDSSVGSRLPAGSRVRTGKRSACEIKFPDGSRCRMGARSDCVITDPDSTKVKVVSGEVLVEVVSGQGGASVEGGSSTAAVRGTWIWFRGPTAPGEKPERTTDSVFAWFGDVDYFSEEGSLVLQPGQGSTLLPSGEPGPPQDAYPPEYGNGREFPWWARVRSGFSVAATPGTSVAEDFKNNDIATRTVGFNFGAGGLGFGDVGVIVEALPALGGASASGFPTLGALALAPLSLQTSPRELGNRFYALPGQIDLAAFAIGDGGFGAIWGRASAVSGQYFGEVGLELSTDFRGDPDTGVSDLYVMNRQKNTDFVIGRQRYLLGPVNNGPLGSLFGVVHYDGFSVDHRGPGYSLYGAWIDDFHTPTGTPRRTGGWLARASVPVLGGQLGVTALQERHADWGWSADLVLPALPGYLDTYAEAGVDPQGRVLNTYGVYFPSLYQATDIDLYVECAQRQHFPMTWTALAYKDAGAGWTGLAGVRKVEHQDWEFAFGFTKHFGGLAF